MRTLAIPLVLSLTLVAGCLTGGSARPLATTHPASVRPSNGAPHPTTLEALARGFTNAMGRGDVAAARRYFLSDAEFASLFSWSGPTDPRVGLDRRIDTAIRATVGPMHGAQFKRLANPGAKATSLKAGTKLAGLVLKRTTDVLDSIGAVVELNGLSHTLRLDGLVKVDGYWRLYSPSFEFR